MTSNGQTQSCQSRAHLLDVRHADALQNELSDTVSLVDFEVLGTVVENNHSDRPPVIVVHDSRPDIDHFLHSQPRSGGDARIRVGRDGDGEIGPDESLASGGYGGLVGAGKEEHGRRDASKKESQMQGIIS